MTHYEIFDISVKCAGLAVVGLLLAMLFVPPILRRRDEDEDDPDTSRE